MHKNTDCRKQGDFIRWRTSVVVTASVARLLSGHQPQVLFAPGLLPDQHKDRLTFASSMPHQAQCEKSSDEIFQATVLKVGNYT
jgi:hypothetical protein